MKLRKTKEKLVCDCEDGGKHKDYIDQNGEKVIECEVCGRFIKLLK